MTGGMITSGQQARLCWHAVRRHHRRHGLGAAGLGVGRPPSPARHLAFRAPRGAGTPFSTAAPEPRRARDAAPPPGLASLRPSHVAALSKARLSALVVSTAAFGFLAAGPGALTAASLPAFAACSVGTALCAGSAATFNQVLEADRDARMKRTGGRPLVTGAVGRGTAAGVGGALGLSGGALLGLGTDPVTTLLGVGNIGLYAGLYTYLKPRSELNTWVGAVVGAVPPVMGWTAAGGSVFDAEAVLLGGTLFLWQFPHFFALNWMYRTDYARGGFRMVAVDDPVGDRTARLITRYARYLAALPFLSTALGVTSPMFAVDGGLLLNGYALYAASRFEKERSNANARKVFLTSLWYLPCAMMLFLLHSRRWREEATDAEVEDASLLASVRTLLNAVRSTGRDLCVHESLAAQDVGLRVGGGDAKATPLDGSKCPLALAKAVAGSAGAALGAPEGAAVRRDSGGGVSAAAGGAGA